ncbi:hypothetical protein [Achromobacter sp. NCFB-sbj8-Ac1-l]|uniref:hypothetical protein n=1 Tax=unclassified Achromobacter TaxID=2626865 RepID=UPI004046E10E
MKNSTLSTLDSNECAFSRYLALFLLSFFAFCVALGWLNQMAPVGGVSRQLAFPIALIGAVVSSVALGGIRKGVLPPLLCLIALGALLYISSWFLDLSWDGLMYHQRAVIALLKGANFLSAAEPTGYIWVDTYAKATWFYGATLVSWFGRTELGASYHFVLGGAAAAYLYGFCREVGRGRMLSLIVALVAFFNPVALVQFFSYYNDAALGAFGILLFLSAMLVVRENRLQDRVIFVASAVFAVNVKASGIILVGAAFLYLGLAVLLQTRSFIPVIRKVGLPFAVFCVLGIGVFGFSPYVQNLKNDRHILYPLMGEKAVDIISDNSPFGFPQNNRFHNLFLSLFSKSEDLLIAVSKAEPTLKVPGQVSKREVLEFWRTDLRIGGFGPLFSLALVLTLLSFCVLRLNWKVAGPLTFMIFMAVVVNPHSWWARYSPIIWMFPLIPIISMREFRFKLAWLAPALLVLAMATNIGLLLWSWIHVHAPTNAYLKAAGQSLKGKKLKIYQGIFVTDLLIERLGMEYEKVDKEYYEKNKGRFVDLNIGISYERD